MPPCINATIYIIKICNIISKNEGGVKGRLEFFQKFIRFGSGILPQVKKKKLYRYNWLKTFVIAYQFFRTHCFQKSNIYGTFYQTLRFSPNKGSWQEHTTRTLRLPSKNWAEHKPVGLPLSFLYTFPFHLCQCCCLGMWFSPLWCILQMKKHEIPDKLSGRSHLVETSLSNENSSIIIT